MTPIVRIVGSTFPKRRDLTQEELDVYEKDYIKYATRLWKKININSDVGLAIFRSALNNFEYYLRDRILIEDMEKKNGI